MPALYARYTVCCQVLLLGGFSGSALAALQPVSDAPLATKESLSCRFNADESTDCSNTLQITILKPLGVEMVSKIDLSYSELDSLEIVTARVVQPDGQSIPLANTQMDTRMYPNPVKGFTSEKQTSLAFPNLKVGSTIEYTARIHYAAIPLIDNLSHFGGLHLRPSAVRYDSYQAEFISERPIQWRAEAMEGFDISSSADKKRVKVSLIGVKYNNLVGELEGSEVRVYPRLQLAASLDIQANFWRLAQRHNEILQAPLPAAMALAVQAVQGKSAPEKVAALMQYIADNYRYLGDWRKTERGYIPFSLAEIAEHGYGDCKDLSSMLVAMLRAADIKAEPAWVHRGTFAPKLLLPGIAAANHEIVRAEVDGRVWWLDPTNPVFMSDFVMPDLQERWALVVSQEGRVRTENIPIQGHSVEGARQRTLKFLSDGSAEISVNAQLVGDRLLALSLGERTNGADNLNTELCAAYGHSVMNCRVERQPIAFLVPDQYQLEVRYQDQRAAIPIAPKKFLIDQRHDEFWDLFSKYLSGRGQNDIYLEGTEIYNVNTKIHNVKIDRIPKACQVRSPWFDLDVKWYRQGKMVAYNFRREQKTRWLSHAEITSSAFRQFLNQVHACSGTLQQVVQII